MQYSSSIDDFARIMKEGNNGGYANTWLVADNKNNEIASLELGLKHVTLERTKDGYFVGANFPANPELIRDEARQFSGERYGISANARHVRWDQLMAENKGKIDVAAAQRFLADHYDTFDKKIEPDERTLCGHIDLSPRGSKPWQPEYGPAGAVQNKAANGVDGGPDGVHCGDGPLLRAELQGRATFEGAFRVRVGEERAARSGHSRLDYFSDCAVGGDVA